MILFLGQSGKAHNHQFVEIDHHSSFIDDSFI